MSAELDIERAKREAAEKSALDAANRAASERAAREAAERAAREATDLLAKERLQRQALEEALKQASAKSSQVETERDTALKSACDFAAAAKAEKASREYADLAARELVSVERSSISPSTLQAVAAQESQSKPQPQAIPAPPSPPPSSSPSPSSGSAAPGWIIPISIFAIAGILFFVISSLWTSWENTTSVKTDDAYVRADVAPLSTKVAGIVKRADVTDYQHVKAGDILVELKNDEYRARVDQAKEALEQAKIKLDDMKQRKEQQDARVLQAGTAISTARETVKQSDDGVAVAKATIEEANAGIAAAQAALLQSQAAIRSATADVKRAKLERDRQEALLANESTTNDKVEQVVNEHDRASANLDVQNAAQAKAMADLMAKKALLAKAKQLLTSAMSDRDKALLAVQGHNDELVMQQKQRELLNGEERSLASDVLSKRAGLIAAQTDLDYTVVRAPQDGVVGELKVKPGQLVSAGTQVITAISSVPWLIANYRETQLEKVAEGDSAQISLDALPGRHFKGHVERISPASGAQFSLLAPDNASGNFTKITQRIPVKIKFDEDAKALASVRPGMSAVVTITPENKH